MAPGYNPADDAQQTEIERLRAKVVELQTSLTLARETRRNWEERAERAEADLKRLRSSARDEIAWHRGIIELVHDPLICPYCGEDDYGITEDWDDLEPCASCIGQAECRQGDGAWCVAGCPSCLGCDTESSETRRVAFDDI